MENQLSKIKNIVLIASGKGGVGKSTVATNLAVSLSREGYATGLLDADLYGPSVPLTMGMEGFQPTVNKNGDKESIQPVMNYGVKVMSIGFMMKKEDAVIWRGPMASNVLTQLLENTVWGDLDFLIIDMPPGTGDICITLAQKIPKAKAILVVTPQKIATADGRRAANMFRANGIDIPVLGIVENMSYFVPMQHPEERYTLFGEGGGQELAAELNIPLLAKIPMVEDVCGLCDAGKTVFASASHILVSTFLDLAQTMVEKLHLPAMNDTDVAI
jgi:ATP-binding protein involved in chromosome partitioning